LGFFVVLFVSIFFGVIAFWWPDIILVIFFISSLFIPNEILPFLSGTSSLYGFGPVRLHPAGVTIFIGSLIVIIIKRELIKEKIDQFDELRKVIFLLTFFIISIFLQTFLFRGLRGIPQCLENYFFPFVFFLYLITINEEKLFKFLKLYVIFIIVISVYAIFEYILKHNYLYHYLYAHSYKEKWGTIINNIYRSKTTLGYPLKNASYFLFSLPISIYLFKIPFNFISSVILFVAVITTGSRMAFILSIIVILFCYFKYNLKLYKNIFLIIFILLILYILLFKSPLGIGILTRFHKSHGSTFVRLFSIKNSFSIMKNNFIIGKGMGISFLVSSALFKIEEIGFEIPWIMLIVDIGLITTFIYMMAIIIIIKKRINYIKIRYLKASLLVSFISILIMFSSFDSFGAMNTLNFLFWFNGALLYVGSNNKLSLMLNKTS